MDRNDSLQLADPTGRRLYELTSIATQFHAGATMALDSLAKLGLTAKVHVHDVGASAEVWAPVLRDPEVRDMHLYLGPFHRSAIEQLSAISKNGHIVCPVPQSNRVVLGNARVSKVIGGRTEQVYQVARYVAGRYAKENVLLVLPSSTDESELQGQMRRVLREAINVRPDRLRDSVPEIRIGKKDIAELNAKLDKNRVNILVVPTESVEFVTSFVTRTVPLVEKYRIKVFGLQAWDAMANLEVADLNKLNVHLPLSTFVDRSDSRVIAFTREFRKRTNSDPGDYAFLGFDCTMFYGKALLEQGLDLASAFTRVHTRPLHMEFHMRRMGDENGFVNDSARIIEYKDLERHLAP